MDKTRSHIFSFTTSSSTLLHGLSTNMCMQQNFNELYFDLLPSHNIVMKQVPQMMPMLCDSPKELP